MALCQSKTEGCTHCGPWWSFIEQVDSDNESCD